MALELLVGLNVTDDISYQTYRSKMTPILEKMNGGFGYDFKISDVLLSEVESPINRVFTIYFPDEETKDEFFSNEEYLRIKNSYYIGSVSATTIIATYERP